MFNLVKNVVDLIKNLIFLYIIICIFKWNYEWKNFKTEINKKFSSIEGKIELLSEKSLEVQIDNVFLRFIGRFMRK